MYCTKCGTQINDKDNFCSACGYETPGGETRRQNNSGYSAPRRLYRLTNDKKIAGVCSGLAKYLDADVTLIRLAVIAMILLSGGIGLLVYIAAWIIMPTDRNVTGFQPARDPSHVSV